MEQHIVEILVFLMKSFPEGAITPEEFEPLTQDLMGKGYSENEIEAAIFWFFHRLEVKKKDKNSIIDSNYIRILSEFEKSIIAPSSYGYLLELKQLGIITLNDMNTILDKVIHYGGKSIDVDEIKIFVAGQLIEQDNMFPMPGMGFILRSSTDRVQ